MVRDGAAGFVVKDMRQNEKDISEANKEIESAKADIEAAEAKISDLYSFADSVEIQRDLLAGVEPTMTIWNLSDTTVIGGCA